MTTMQCKKGVGGTCGTWPGVDAYPEHEPPCGHLSVCHGVDVVKQGQGHACDVCYVVCVGGGKATGHHVCIIYCLHLQQCQGHMSFFNIADLKVKFTHPETLLFEGRCTTKFILGHAFVPFHFISFLIDTKLPTGPKISQATKS